MVEACLPPGTRPCHCLATGRRGGRGGTGSHSRPPPPPSEQFSKMQLAKGAGKAIRGTETFVQTCDPLPFGHGGEEPI